MAEMTVQARLVAALSEMTNPVRDTEAFKYKYADLAQVLGIVRPTLAAHGLAVRQRSERGPQQDWVLVTSVTDGTEELVVDERSLVDSPDAQVKGSYETYMRRYALLTAFGLAAEDDDGAATVGAARAQEPAGRPRGGKSGKYSQPVASVPPAAPQGSRGRFADIAELKARCLAAGIDEASIREWLERSFVDGEGRPVPMRDMDDTQLETVKMHLSRVLFAVEKREDK